MFRHQAQLDPHAIALRSSERYVAKLRAEQKARAKRARHGAKHSPGMTRATTADRSAASRKRDRAARKSRRTNR